jgi:hypothetical protein
MSVILSRFTLELTNQYRPLHRIQASNFKDRVSFNAALFSAK